MKTSILYFGDSITMNHCKDSIIRCWNYGICINYVTLILNGKTN